MLSEKRGTYKWNQKVKLSNRHLKMKRSSFVFILVTLLFSCDFNGTESAINECSNIHHDLDLCVKSINDSIEEVYTSVAGIQDGLTIRRVKKNKQVLALNNQKNWKQNGLQYDFYSNGNVQRVRETYNGREINWKIEFEQDGKIKTAKYGHDQIDRTEMGAKLIYSNGVLDIQNSIGVVRTDFYDDVVFKVLIPEPLDSIYFILLNSVYDVIWSRKCTQDSVVISQALLERLDPSFIRVKEYHKIDGTPHVGDNFLKFKEILPSLLRAPKVIVPSYLSKAGK